MITIPAPNPIDGGALQAELIAAGLPADTEVALVGSEVRLNVGEEYRTTAESVAASHVPPTPPPDPYAVFVNAMNSATTLPAIKTAVMDFMKAKYAP